MPLNGVRLLSAAAILVAVIGLSVSWSQKWARRSVGRAEADIEPISRAFLSHQIDIAFELADAGDCYEQRFDGIRVDGDLLHAAVVNLDLLDNALDEHSMCELSYSALTYIAAVDRSRLPEPPFRIKSAPSYAAETTVDVDLRIPGAEAPPRLAERRGILP